MSTYTSYRGYSARYDSDEHTIMINFAGYEGWFKVGVEAAYFDGNKIFDIDSYAKCESYVESRFDCQVLHVDFSSGPIEQDTFGVAVTLSKDGAAFRMQVMGHFDVRLNGSLRFGTPGRAVCLNRRGPDLRATCGPASSSADNALFDVQKDAALEVIGPAFLMEYDWDNDCYAFTMRTGGDDIERDFRIRVHERLYETRFGIPYAPMNHNTAFSKPPVGWMTWYAVQFGACEDAVLENARFQLEKLAPYGANAIWVDWEWYHQDFSGTGKPGVDIFHPDPDRYPNGLKHVADEITKMGFIPALWIGASNDPNMNEFICSNPETLLVQKRSWCGQYFIDPTNPKVKNEYLPRVFSAIKDMGYKALKWDCLPVTFERMDQNHDKLYDKSVSTDEAMRDMVKIARDVVGKDFYMLSCSGDTKRDMLFAGDIFDAARIGGDIFRWSEFVTSGVNRMLEMYPFHNTLLYADPDNVVIRKKYNTFDQAISRVSIVSMLGLPYTLGDILPDLEPERLDLIRRTIPVLDICPSDIRDNPKSDRQLIVNLSIAKRWEKWNVVDVMNLLQTTDTVNVDLKNDLHLDTGAGKSYLLFDFWKHKYLGEVTDAFNLELAACESRVIAVRKKTGNPQILSTTRHISQGALELDSVRYDEKAMLLSGVSELVAGDDYSIYLYLPAGLRVFFESNDTDVAFVERMGDDESACYESQSNTGCVWKVTLDTTDGGRKPWSVAFTSCHAM